MRNTKGKTDVLKKGKSEKSKPQKWAETTKGKRDVLCNQLL